MNTTLRQEIADTLQAALGNTSSVVSITPAASSSFSSTARLVLQNGDLLFAKYSSNPSPAFQCEYDALHLLHDTRTLRVPEPVCSSEHCIITRWIEFGGKAADWQEKFGYGLALLHQARQSSR